MGNSCCAGDTNKNEANLNRPVNPDEEGGEFGVGGGKSHNVRANMDS
jgi:hypothetical protein